MIPFFLSVERKLPILRFFCSSVNTSDNFDCAICIGSACHLKGSREIIAKLQKLVDENGLSDKVDLNGAFCTGNCDHGVCVTVEGELYSLRPEDTEEFFENEIKGRL